MPRLRAFWDAARRKPGLTTTAGALVVLVGGWLVGLPMLLAFLGAFALVVVGASVVNGRYVRRRLLILVPTLVLITAFTFYLENSRGDAPAPFIAVNAALRSTNGPGSITSLVGN